METYEKKYEQLRKFILDLYPHLSYYCKEKVEGFLPEIQAQKDERIRKELIKVFQHYDKECKWGEFTTAEILDWLEKHGDIISWKPTEEQYKALDYAYNSCSDTEIGNYYEGVLETLIEDLHKFENQCQDKESAISQHKEYKEQVMSELADLIKDSIEQKSVDKAEPKFNKGDWVVQGCNILKILCVGAEYYSYETVGGYVGCMLISELDSLYHLWTIEDAKDGDVLQLGEVTAIFKKYIGNEHCICYCSFCNDGGFENPIANGEDNNYGCHFATPATKEQRDFLFQKMKEKGYEWSADMKELRKIAQNNNEESNEGNCEIDGLYCAKEILEKTLGKVEGYQTDDGILEHKSAIYAVKKLCEQKPIEEISGNIEKISSIWSKEDEEVEQPQSKQKLRLEMDDEDVEDADTDFVCKQIRDIDILRELYQCWLNYCDVCSFENVLFLHCGQFYITMERDIDNLISEHIFVPHYIFENHQDEYVHYACFDKDNFHKLTQRIDDLDNTDYNIIRLDNNTIATRLKYD